MSGQLDSHSPYAAGRPMDQNLIARLYLRLITNERHGGEIGIAKTTQRQEVLAGWYFYKCACLLHTSISGHAAKAGAHRAVHVIVHSKTCASRPHRHDDTGNIVAQDIQPRTQQARKEPDNGWVRLSKGAVGQGHRAGMNFDENLTLTGHRLRAFDNLDDVGGAIAALSSNFHLRLLLGHAGSAEQH